MRARCSGPWIAFGCLTSIESWWRPSSPCRRRTRTAIESGDGLALGAIRHTHLRFGELDLYQWILFVAEHEARHTAQVREVARQLVPAS